MIAASTTQLTRTTERVTTPQRQTRSALERNFIAAASSTKPITTLVDWSQPPARGNREIHSGTSASTQNGSANTVE